MLVDALFGCFTPDLSYYLGTDMQSIQDLALLLGDLNSDLLLVWQYHDLDFFDFCQQSLYRVSLTQSDIDIINSSMALYPPTFQSHIGYRAFIPFYLYTILQKTRCITQIFSPKMGGRLSQLKERLFPLM